MPFPLGSLIDPLLKNSHLLGRQRRANQRHAGFAVLAENAMDEQAVFGLARNNDRAGVSALARMAAPSEVARRWPWFFAASCVRDDSSRSLTKGKAATAAGRILITNDEQEAALLAG